MFRDWELYPNLGAGLDQFVGESNSKNTGDRLHDRVRLALVSNNLVAEEDLQVVVMPVHLHKVLIIVKIAATPTAFNKLDSSSNKLAIGLVFDFIEQSVSVLDKIPNFQGRLR